MPLSLNGIYTKAVYTKEFAAASASCPELCALREQMAGDWLLSMAAISAALRLYFKLCHEVSVQDDFIFHGFRLVVPVVLRHIIVTLAHEGHQGVVRTKQRLCDVYWPVPFPSEPWEKLGIDVVGPFETATMDCHFAITLSGQRLLLHPLLQPLALYLSFEFSVD